MGERDGIKAQRGTAGRGSSRAPRGSEGFIFGRLGRRPESPRRSACALLSRLACIYFRDNLLFA